MRQVVRIAVLAFALVGCTSDPIESDEPNSIVRRCCNEVRSQVASIKDIESSNFNDRCGACRKGKSKAGCASAVEKIDSTVRGAYGSTSMPVLCTTMKSTLREHGIE